MTIERYDVHEFELEGPATVDNPYTTTVTADFEHESGETLDGVQGWYAGNDRWIIRWSPPKTGEWIGKTTADASTLDDQPLGPITCVENTDPERHGPIALDPANPNRFQHADGTAFIPLAFECDWLFAYHQEHPDQCRAFLETLKARGFNEIVMNVYAHTGFGDASQPYVYGPPAMYPFGGTNDDPTHEVLNPAFFADLDELFDLLYDLGLTAHLMIQVQNKEVNWPERQSPADDRYWRHVVARYGAYPNLIWDVSKEAYNLRRETGSHAYTRDRIALIREIDAFDHLVTAHDSDRGRAPRRFCVEHPDETCVDDVVDFVADQFPMDADDLPMEETTNRYVRDATLRYRDQSSPYLNIENAAEEGVKERQSFTRAESTCPWQEAVVYTWGIYVGGGYSCYYYTNTAWDVIEPEPEPPGWQRFVYLRETLDSLEVNRMSPAHEVVSDGYCLAELGKQYLCFLPTGGDLAIDLTHLTGGGDWNLDLDGSFEGLTCEVLDVFTGERVSVAPHDDRGGYLQFMTAVENPLSEPDHPCAVVIRAE